MAGRKGRVRARRALDPRQLQMLSLLAQQLVTVPAERRPVAPRDHDLRVRRWLHEAIDESPLDREEIAAGMTALAGRTVTKAMLDTWTAESRPNRFPFDLADAFCAASGTTTLMTRMAEAMGLRLADSIEARLARMGQWALIAIQAKAEQEAIAASLPALPLLRGTR